MTSSNILLVVLDGVGDLKSAELGNKTPLQAASTKNLDRLFSRCSAGYLYPVGKGIAPESDAAIMSLLGYDVRTEYTGRGPLESFGAGLSIDGNTLALRCNFATIDSKRNITDRRAGRDISRGDAEALESEINKIRVHGISLEFRATVGHRGVLVIRSGRKLSANISNADIGYVKSGNISIAVQSKSRKLPRFEALDKGSESRYSAEVLNNIQDSVIERLAGCEANIKRQGEGRLPANVLLMRDAGLGLPSIKSFRERYGLNAAFIAEMPVERGIARLAGMKELRIDAESPNNEKYARMAELINKNYTKFDFIYAHIKGPDEPGHDGDARLKKRIIEEIDSIFFGAISETTEKLTVAVTGDHSTPCSKKSHSADPVPLAIRSVHKERNTESLSFDEESTLNGNIGGIYGRELLKTLLEYR